MNKKKRDKIVSEYMDILSSKLPISHIFKLKNNNPRGWGKLAEIDFDFYTYYSSLKEKGQKTAFKYLVQHKLSIEPRTFEQWVYRKSLPGGSIQVQMIDLINDPNNHLPNYKI